jgi:hypothetical protein
LENRRIALAHALLVAKQRSPEREAAAKVTFSSQRILIFKIEEIVDGGLIGHANHGGTIVIPFNKVETVEFV